ncbi:2'-5' RNA ligase family protein [Fluviicola sp.]|uniref:2'-5' RNA ligase family protein n=1 Tax=Fluviicola sp. TaxID=1917219 RepID=UPI002601D341|nr:2'-5' RNA ligase family protein [Fluviicola sp.]
MNKQLDIFGGSISGYLIVIEPDHATSQKVVQLKQQLDTIFPLPEDVLHSKPHISLCYFEANESSEELIKEKLTAITASLKPFTVVISGVEKWKNGTFILQLIQNEALNYIQKELSHSFKGVTKTPHLTIARTIPERILEQVSPDYFDYQGDFICESILILKKSPGKSYQTLSMIAF